MNVHEKDADAPHTVHALDFSNMYSQLDRKLAVDANKPHLEPLPEKTRPSIEVEHRPAQ